jgi:hypothetical protein
MKRENYEQWGCKKLHVLGLFKNVQMQGAQKLSREAYYTYVERCGLQRNIADHGALQGMDFFQQSLRHFKYFHSRRRFELENFLRQSRIDGNIGKFQRGGIAHNIIEAYLQNIKTVFVNCQLD